MRFLGINKKASVGTDDTIKWIIWIAILVVSGLAIKTIVSKAIG